MSSNRVRPLKALVAMRERQVPRLEQALAQQQRLLEERQQLHAQAHEQLGTCRAAEAKACGERAALIGAPFRPDLLTSLDYAIGDLATRTKQATQHATQVDAAVQQQEHAVAAARREIVRNQQRIDQFKERITALQKEREVALEEAAEEEAEEGAASRLVRRRAPEGAT